MVHPQRDRVFPTKCPEFHLVGFQTTKFTKRGQIPRSKTTKKLCFALEMLLRSGTPEWSNLTPRSALLLDSISELCKVVDWGLMESSIPIQTSRNWNSTAKCCRSYLPNNTLVSCFSDSLTRAHASIAMTTISSPYSEFQSPTHHPFTSKASLDWLRPQPTSFSLTRWKQISPWGFSIEGVVYMLSPAGGVESSGSAGFGATVGSPDTTLTALSSEAVTTSRSSQAPTQFSSSDRASVNEYGFFTNVQPESGLPPVTHYPEPTRHSESKNNEKWRRLLSTNAEQNWCNVCESQSRILKKEIRKGIPRDWRYRVWPLLTGGQFLLEHHSGRYNELLRQPCRVEDGILDDLHRTLPNHVLFSESGGTGQEALHRILKAYSIFDPAVGYAPGTASIVAVLLVVLEEESAFWTFVALMSDEVHGSRPASAGPLVKCRNLFLEGVPLMWEMISKLKHLLKEKLPAVAQKFAEADIDTLQYGPKWCMTLFCFILPFQHLVRVWDVFFLEGWKTAFRTCLAILRLMESEILQQHDATVGEVLDVKAIAERIPSPDAFIRMMLNVRISRSLETWRPEEDDHPGQG